MPLMIEQIDTVTALLVSADPTGHPLATLRQRMAGISFSRCDRADMSGETPYRRLPSCDLYLVDTAGHCWRLVSDPIEASGFILAN